MRWLLAIACMLSSAFTAAANAGIADLHNAWNDLLKRHVQWNAQGTSSTVDYEGFGHEADALSAYLQTLSEVGVDSFEQWDINDREAFLINAYNAATVQLVLTRYPGLESIRDLGGIFSSPWKKKFVELLGQQRSLDSIEHELLRGAPDHEDARIHFAVNCASIGCPALRNEAYTASELQAQLQDQTVRYLRNRNQNHVSGEGKTLVISKIFDWYADDFSSYAGSVQTFLPAYGDALEIDTATRQSLKSNELQIRFSDYDWSLNSTHP